MKKDKIDHFLSGLMMNGSTVQIIIVLLQTSSFWIQFYFTIFLYSST